MLIASAIALLVGMLALEIEAPALAALLAHWRGAWWAVAAVIICFTALAFLGAPQVVLISATLLAYGPIWGTVLSWCATMMSACVGFWLGRWAGAEQITRWGGGPLLGRAAAFVARRAMLSAFLVRLVPTGPFLVVNGALGASSMAFWRFALGTGVGIAPKILLLASLGGALNWLVAHASSWAAWILAVLVLLGGGWVWVALRPRPKKTFPMPTENA